MVDINFYRLLGKEDSREVTVGTITECSGWPEGELSGLKFMIRSDGEIVFSRETPPDVKEMLSMLIREKGIAKLSQPVLERVEAAGGHSLEVYLEPLADRPRLIIFGSGHIAIPLAKVGQIIDFEVMVIDDREDLLTAERFPGVDSLICSGFEDYLERLVIRPDDYLVIVTRGHKYDYLVLREVIDSQAAYIGMIGSSRKVKLIFEELLNGDGISQGLIDRVHAPIGLEIGSETPGEIAVSIAGELVVVRRKKDE